MNFPPCEDCGRPVRHPRNKAADHPGTAPGYAGVCLVCRRRRMRGEAPRTPDPADVDAQHDDALKAGIYDHIPITIAGLESDDLQVRHVARQAQNFLDARRCRGVPPQGAGAHKTDTKEGAA